MPLQRPDWPALPAAAVCFEFCDENFASDLGTIRTDGALHARASPAASDACHSLSAFPVLTACGASSRSQFKADRGHYASYMNGLSRARPPVGMSLPGQHATEVAGGVQGRGRSVVCIGA